MQGQNHIKLEIKKYEVGQIDVKRVSRK